MGRQFGQLLKEKGQSLQDKHSNTCNSSAFDPVICKQYEVTKLVGQLCRPKLEMNLQEPEISPMDTRSNRLNIKPGYQVQCFSCIPSITNNFVWGSLMWGIVQIYLIKSNILMKYLDYNDCIIAPDMLV